MEQMALLQETAYERLYRWAQSKWVWFFFFCILILNFIKFQLALIWFLGKYLYMCVESMRVCAGAHGGQNRVGAPGAPVTGGSDLPAWVLETELSPVQEHHVLYPLSPLSVPSGYFFTKQSKLDMFPHSAYVLSGALLKSGVSKEGAPALEEIIEGSI